MKKLLLFICFAINLHATSQNFSFLGSYDELGVPDYLEPQNDNISNESMQMIMNALPEGYPVPDYNPHYITSGYDTNIELEKDATVWVTFVKEGAGYKNVLGFYTYDVNDENRRKPWESEITIIFPNASEGGYGGGLRKGNKVKIGDFKAGTGIGWVLLANAWNGSQVTWGLWQVHSDPEFNPEANEDLRHHTVLLSDPENERIYLGFEDIRRDYNSCDQDFNDAIFYVTANPYDAIKTQNLVDVKSATDVSSANKGGLESDGKLAKLIARRNFSRLKSGYSKFDKKAQQKFSQKYSVRKSSEGYDLSSLIPENGMFGSEIAMISSPEDLMGITNAKQVFSADYYMDEKRIAAALITETKNGIYDHSKVICDRLNSSSLEDIRTLELKGYQLIMIKMLRASGQLEYAVNFSVNTNGEPKLHSYWNIADYPEGDYLNFQIWGSNMGQVSSIAGHIIDKLNAYRNLANDEVAGKYPTVFVKKGFYKDSRLHLIVKNKNKNSGLKISGNLRATETAEEIDFTQTKVLNSEFEQELVVESGALFDIGMQIIGNNSPKPDALYLADGPWGIDYNETETDINEFIIEQGNQESATQGQRLERNVAVNGRIKGTANIFRSLLPGDQVFDVSYYEALQFDLKSSLPMEVILVTEEMDDWNKRYRLSVDASDQLKTINLSLEDFSNGTSSYKNEKLKAVVFSVQGDYSSFKNFNLNIEKVVFTNNTFDPIDNEQPVMVVDSPELKAFNYPNPFKSKTTVVAPMDAKTAELYIYDITGRIIWSKKYTSFRRNMPVALDGARPGIYKAVLILDGRHKFALSLLVTH